MKQLLLMAFFCLGMYIVHAQVYRFSGASAFIATPSAGGSSSQLSATTTIVDGSGFFYEYEGGLYFITAYHVVQSLKSIDINVNGLTLKYKDGESLLDIVVYEVPERQRWMKPLTFCKNKQIIGAAVKVLNTTSSPAWGKIITLQETTFSELVHHPFVMKTSCTVKGGNSGSPLLNGKNEVVGIVVATNADTSYALDGNKATETIIEIIEKRPKRIYLGLVFEEKGGAVFLKDILPNSPNQDKRGYVGKKISYMNGTAINTLFDVRKALESPNAAGAFKIKLNGIEVDFISNHKKVTFCESVSEYFLANYATFYDKTGSWQFACKSAGCNKLKPSDMKNLCAIHTFSKGYKADSKKYLGVVLWLFSPMPNAELIFKFGDCNLPDIQENFSFGGYILFG